MHSTTARRRTAARRAPRPGRRVGALLLSAPLLAAALAGCSARSVPAAVSSVAGQTVVSTPGSLTVLGQKNDPDSPSLRITGAVLVPGPQSDNEELRMTVANLSQAEEHLYAASTANASSVGLFTTPPGAGATPQPADAGGGVELDAGTTTVFGPGGPRILLEEPTGLAHARTVEVTLVFALAGIVHLTAVISPSAASAAATSATASATARPTESAG